MQIEDTHIQQASRHQVEGHAKKAGLGSVKERRDHGHHPDDEKSVHRHKRPDRVAISDEARARFESTHKRPSEASGRQFDIPAGLDNAGLLGRLVPGAFAGHGINITDAVTAGSAASPPSELFSLSFKFNISSEVAGAEDGSGLLTVDRHEETSGEIDEDRHSGELEEDSETATPALSVPDFFKALRKADFTSTYLSFSKTTIEASSYLAVAEGAPLDGFVPGALSSSAGAPVDLIA